MGDLGNPHSGVYTGLLNLGFIGLEGEKKIVNYQSHQAATNDTQNTYLVMRVLSLLTVARMDDLGISIIRAVSLLLANKRLVDLGLQVRLAGLSAGIMDIPSQSTSVLVHVSRTDSTHLFRILLNRNSRPSLVSSRKLLSSLENEIRGSLSNSATLVGKSILTKQPVGETISKLDQMDLMKIKRARRVVEMLEVCDDRESRLWCSRRLSPC